SWLFLFPVRTRSSRFRLRLHVRAGKPARLFVFAQEQEQQRFESDESMPELGRQLWYRIRDDDAGAADAISSEGARESRHLSRRRRASVCESIEPFPDDAWDQRSRRNPSGLWIGCKRTHSAGRHAGFHGLLSSACGGGADGAAAGASYS